MAKQPDRALILDTEHLPAEFIRGKNHLLTIGIDQYKHLGKLANAVRDASAFKQLLQEKYCFEAAQTTELLDTNATLKRIMRALRNYIKSVKPTDSLLVYFSGHGHYDQQINEGYWVPVDAEFGEVDDYIPYSSLIKLIKAIPSRHTVFIVDSCYSGAVLIQDRDTSQGRLEKDPSRWLLASGRNEVVPDGIGGHHSPFADKLLDFLNRYANEGLRMGTLVDNLITAVTNNSRQTPVGRPLFGVGDQGGQFVFRPKNSREKEAETTSPEPSIQTRSLTNFPIPQMVQLAGGAFEMGNIDGPEDEQPLRTVHLPPFEIGKYPVTQREWKAVMGKNPSHFKGPNHPVESVSLDDCLVFIQKLNERTGLHFRLPSEAEWEYAAAGGKDARTRWAGTNEEAELGEYAWYSPNSEKCSHPVGQKRPNLLGLYDMSGQVLEWCEDAWYPNYLGAPQDGSARVDPNRHRRILRGGSWFNEANRCRTSYRDYAQPGQKLGNIGLRLARSL